MNVRIRSTLIFGVILALAVTVPFAAEAQFAGGGFGGGQGGGQGCGVGGIAIDASGVVAPVFQKEVAFKLTQKRLKAFSKKNFPADLNTPSELRMISLVRLEQACRKFAEEKTHVTPEIQYLAGLQRIDYVFLYPDTGDLVIAGPAEGFAPDQLGRVVGVTTGRPPVRLDDLIVALRTVRQTGQIGCSIDPTQSGLQAFQEYVRRNSSPTTTAVIQRRFREMTQALGRQKVSVFGVPGDSHFAQVLVEADYRMKLMAIGLEKPRLKGFLSHLKFIRPGQNTFQRWWFAPLYDAFQQSEDGDAFAFAGQRLQLMAEEEHVSAAGTRTSAKTSAASTQKYAQQFTKRFEELAKIVPVFAELQNITDLAVLAALMQKKQLAQKVGWEMQLFFDEARTPLVKGNVPKEVQSVYGTRLAGRLILGFVAGGVELSPIQTVSNAKFEPAGPVLMEASTKARPARVLENWWWD